MEILRLIYDPKTIKYSRENGCFFREFEYKGMFYRAELQPLAVYNSCCVIRKIEDREDVNNITASEDSQRVYFKSNIPFNILSLSRCLKEFINELI